MASELIIQVQNSNGGFNCEKFDNLPSPKSVYIAICFSDNKSSEQLAINLKMSLTNAISNLGNNFISSQAPCGEHAVGFNRCQALDIPNNLKLLIVVSDGASSTFAEPEVLNWVHKTLPVLQSGKPVTLPSPLNIPNAVFWNSGIDEVIPTIFSLIGISEEDQRIFISYRRIDTAVLAEQLFDRLSHEGFEVFLDRFSINPGVNFQNRLYQELADKAMIVFLESSEFLLSHWIQLEVAFAKKYRLGILALNINGANKTPSIDDESRINLNINATGQITDSKLDVLVTDIREKHSIALYRKKHLLNLNIVASIESFGASTNYDNNGFISSTNRAGNLDYKILASPRPPKLSDYHYSDISNPIEEKIMVGPEFMEENRKILNNWISRKSNVTFFNEGELLKLANLIYS